ncbi:MAG: IPT/TIG domain-containing protein [Anaerolineae bacterium]|nr:IPT/TIG domain-containing protein [Anaerolineae bacterium]
MRLARCFLWILGLALLLLPAALPMQNLMGAAPPPRTPPPPEEWGKLPYQASPANAAATDPEITISATFMDWSAVVYEAIADNNWEIYYRDAAKEVRLTYHGAMDIHPRLNRGVSKIVFASDRTGDYQLYTMNLDGSGVTQLTFTPADNGNPAWSPDGNKIAFESYRDGQAEIYVMDASGANQRRLTAADGPDTHPTWSPDGTQIAFSSGRTGGYRIWTMQADGNQLRQASTQPYSLYPAWSPDGQWIAYSCDSNGDGWLEAWKVRHDNSAGSVLVYSAQHYGGTTQDVLVRSWTPDGQRVAFTHVDMIYYEGEWYWTRSWLSAASDSTNAIGLSNTKVGWNPDVQTKDVAPPIATLRLLPEYLQASSQRIRSDILQEIGPSGGASIEFQYRVSDGPWESEIWSWEIMEFVGYYFHDVFGSAGSVMSFRIRATDFSLNRSAWYPSDTGMVVSFYNSKITGQVVDMRRTPNCGANITSNPPTLGDRTSGTDGNYTQYTTAFARHAFTITQTGYGALPAMYLDADEKGATAGMPQVQQSLITTEDKPFVHVLPPRQNFIANGNFEAPLAPAWEITGTAMLWGNAAHSGYAGAQLIQSASVTQTLTLPADIPAPTLSLLFRCEAGLLEDSFSIRVQNSTTTTTLLELNSNAPISETLAGGWMHLWYDLDAWRGQTLTFTLSLVDVEDNLNSIVQVDEITLGAWETPSITTVMPGRIEAGATAPITITGGNFIPTPMVHFGATPAASVEWVDKQTLRVIPSAALPFGTHDVIVSNPGGASATQLGGLQVGHRVLLPVVWKVY